MRYQGSSRSPWAIIVVIAVVVIALLAIYLLFLQPR